MRLNVLILCCILVAGCQTPEEARQSWIESNFRGSNFDYPGTRVDYVQVRPDLDEKIKEGILTGWPVKGMTFEQLLACLQTIVHVDTVDSSGYMLCSRKIYGSKLNEPATAWECFTSSSRHGHFPPIVHYTFIDNKLDSWSVHK